MRINRNFVFAIMILVMLGVWLGSGRFDGQRGALSGTNGADTQQTDTDAATPLFAVRAQTLVAQQRAAQIKIRGRTESVRAVEVRAETSGTIETLFVEKGAEVKKDDKLCKIAIDARAALLAEARAGLRKAELDKDAAIKLAGKGFRSETQVASAQAAYDAAQAAVRQMEIEIGRTTIRAPFDGVVDDRYVDIGDALQIGQPCALVVDLDPILIVGAVSEQEVTALKMGTIGTARLIGGQTVEGKIRFLAKSADPDTRTFRMEMEVPNPDRNIRDGITADMVVPAQSVAAHPISPSVLTLDDRGTLGVRIVDDQSKVAFKPVSVIADDSDGVWVTGLPERVTVITVGQEFVSPGQTVDVTIVEDEVKS